MKVLVIGDIILDKYIYGTSNRLSPEAPVPVVNQERIVETMGGAALVYENLKSLGVDASLYDYDQPKSVKTRVMCDGHYVTRIDQDEYADGYDILEDLQDFPFKNYDYVVFSDYNKGVLDFVDQLITIANAAGCYTIVDPKREAHYYKDAWLVKPNHSEFEKFNFSDCQSNIIITHSGHNVIAKLDEKVYDIPVETVEVSDVTGAGDCFLAAFVYGLTKGYDYKKSLELAVRGSTESVKHVGTYILKEQDLQKRVIFTNGCFDVLHKGHLTLLKEARSLGDKLIVGLNSDASVKKLKGESRPVNTEDTRKEQLLLIPYVDEVIIFEEDTPYNLIKSIKPDLIVKGGDYTVEEIVGHDLAPVHIVPTVEGYSTTNIIESVKA